MTDPMRPDDATERHRDLVDALAAAVLEGPGTLPPQLRAAAARDEDVPEPFAGFVRTIHRHAYRVTDRMVEGLAETATDDAVFEVSVAAAYGAARRRLEAGLDALRATRGGA